MLSSSRRAAAHPEGVPKVGDLVAGKYKVEQVIGIGGMGIVVSARHMHLGEQVAIKFLLPKVARDKESLERFLREARAAVRIKSEHIVRVMDVGALESGSPYILMEHLSGCDLAQVVRAHGPLPVHEAIDYVLQASVAIAEAHALSIVHRDLKPSNLFLTTRSDGSPLVKVLDFGISKAIASTETAQDHNLTDTQAVFGSPTYMSPEQVRSAKNVDIRTDVWSLGVILHELLTGETPFRAETVAGLLASIVADAPEPLRKKRPDIAPELEDTVLGCLEKDLARRFQNVGEFASALRPFAADSSQISVERILRLAGGGAAGSGRLPPSRTSVPSASAFAATEKPWTTNPSTQLPKKRKRLLPAILAVVAGGAAMAFLVNRSVPTPPHHPAATATPAVAPVSVPTVDDPEPEPAPSTSQREALPDAGADTQARAIGAPPPPPSQGRRNPGQQASPKPSGVAAVASAPANAASAVPPAKPPENHALDGQN